MGMAAAGAVAGAASGCMYDQSKKNEQKALVRGVKEGQGGKAK